MVSRTRALFLGVLLSAAATGCAGDTAGDQILRGAEDGRPLGAEDSLIERRLVTDRDTRQAQDGSAERAFLEYWSAISYEDWANAVRYLGPRLRGTFDATHLVGALRIEGQSYLPVKPVIRSVSRTRGSVSIRYFVRSSDGRLRPTSSSWEQRKGIWHMVYSATLDDSYGSAVQQAVQNEVDPRGRVAALRALRAGSLARRTQAKTLIPTPTPTPMRRPTATATATPTPGS